MKKYWSLLTAAIVAMAAWALGDTTNAPASGTNTPVVITITPAGGTNTPAGSTNTPAGNQSRPEQDVGVTAKHFLYHDNTVIYFDDVVVTNGQGTLSCERLTIDIPPEGSTDRQPTNAVAETNVVVDLVRKDDTNHVTGDRAVYAYHVLNGMTNDTITFTGSTNNPAKVVNSKGWMTGEPLIWDNVSGSFTAVNPVTHFKVPASAGQGTNAAAETSPLNFFK